MKEAYIILESTTDGWISILDKIFSILIIALIISATVFLRNYFFKRKRKKIINQLENSQITQIINKYEIDEIIRSCKFSEIAPTKEIVKSFEDYFDNNKKFILDKINSDDNNILIISHTIGYSESSGFFHMFFQSQKQNNFIVFSKIDMVKKEMNFYILNLNISTYDLSTYKGFVSDLITILNGKKLLQ